MTTITKKNLRAFTLIEVVVVMAIISIVSGMVIVSLTDSRVKRELETNAREFAGVLREAQNYALTGKQAKVNTTPCGFMVSWSGSGYTFTYKYKDEDEVCNQSSSIADYTLKNGASFSGPNGNVTFTVPHANFSGSTSVKFTKKAIYHTVCISSDGRISDQPGNVNCP